jgi:hypothetical protein
MRNKAFASSLPNIVATRRTTARHLAASADELANLWWVEIVLRFVLCYQSAV